LEAGGGSSQAVKSLLHTPIAVMKERGERER
jgi:hypothetical protein